MAPGLFQFYFLVQRMLTERWAKLHQLQLGLIVLAVLYCGIIYLTRLTTFQTYLYDTLILGHCATFPLFTAILNPRHALFAGASALDRI